MYHIPNKPEKLTFDWLFDRISQEDVYLRYFGFCDLNQKHCNPLRNDNDPQCSFYWHNGVLFFNDFAATKVYTCVSVVMQSERIIYHRALEKIYELFIGKDLVINVNTEVKEKRLKEYKDIKTKIQSFTELDIEYLKSYGITSEFCKKAKWYSIKHYWINNDLKYTYSKHNPCIGYYFNGKWKLYFYLNREWRFLSNTTKEDIQGFDMLPKTGELLIITKSFKDIGTLYRFGINAIAPQSETLLLSPEIIEDLKQRFTTIYSLMDYDRTGILLALQMRKLYNIKPLFLTDKTWNRKGGYLSCKDVSDFYKKFGETELNKLILNEKRRLNWEKI